MPRHALLNNVDHKDLRIQPGHGAHFGDAIMHVATFPAEFRAIQAHYPIVFRQCDHGATFEPVALFGFEPGENLFLAGGGWDATYIPLAVQRQPFLIGVDGDDLLVHIDLANPRCSTTDGEPVFLPHGGTTDFLERANATLLAIHQGLQATPVFMAALASLELLESFVLDVAFDNGAHGRLAGFHTIDEDRLAALGADVLGRLHRAGYLQAIFMAVASMSNLRALIERKNRA